jgi:cation:H+ antiporter
LTTHLAALLTLIYIVGLIFRSPRRILGMGVDSFTVLLAYLIGLAGLIAISTS